MSCAVCGREMAGPGTHVLFSTVEIAKRCFRNEEGATSFHVNETCWRLGYERLKAENASLMESLRAARTCIEFDPPSDALQIIARLRLIVENHNKQCVDFVTERNSAWRRLIEVGKAKKAAEQRAEAAEKALEPYRSGGYDMRADLDSCSEELQRTYAARDAAEQRNTELEGALRALVRLKDGPRDDWYRSAKEKAWADARAALHDEERPKDYDPITAPIPDGDMNGPHGPLPALHDEERSAPSEEGKNG